MISKIYILKVNYFNNVGKDSNYINNDKIKDTSKIYSRKISRSMFEFNFHEITKNNEYN